MLRFGAFALTTSMAAGLILSCPVTAYAAGTPAALTATQMVAALNAAAETTGTAAAGRALLLRGRPGAESGR
jgi:hypothetical protein